MPAAKWVIPDSCARFVDTTDAEGCGAASGISTRIAGPWPCGVPESPHRPSWDPGVGGCGEPAQLQRCPSGRDLRERQPRIHGRLLKLGIDIGQASVSKYMGFRRKPPSQTCRTFLSDHAKDSVSIDFFTVPTATFRVLFVFLILSNDRRRILHFNVTVTPSAAWTVFPIPLRYDCWHAILDLITKRDFGDARPG